MFIKPESYRERESRTASCSSSAPSPNKKDWCEIFSVGYLSCYMLSIQLGVITVSTVQNPLAKSAIVKV